MATLQGTITHPTWGSSENHLLKSACFLDSDMLVPSRVHLPKLQHDFNNQRFMMTTPTPQLRCQTAKPESSAGNS